MSYPSPSNNLVCPLLTDMYQVSMAYAYWSNRKHTDLAVFDLFFRKNPFDGQYCIFAGLDEVLKFVTNFRYSTYRSHLLHVYVSFGRQQPADLT